MYQDLPKRVTFWCGEKHTAVWPFVMVSRFLKWFGSTYAHASSAFRVFLSEQERGSHDLDYIVIFVQKRAVHYLHDWSFLIQMLRWFLFWKQANTLLRAKYPVVSREMFWRAERTLFTYQCSMVYSYSASKNSKIEHRNSQCWKTKR